jgi:hypothetical protein
MIENAFFVEPRETRRHTSARDCSTAASRPGELMTCGIGKARVHARREAPRAGEAVTSSSAVTQRLHCGLAGGTEDRLLQQASRSQARQLLFRHHQGLMRRQR